MPTEQNKPIALTTTATKILVSGHLTEKAKDLAARMPVMTKEVPATVQLYLDGIIEQWWVKPDASGVVFLLNLIDTRKASDLLNALPLGIAGMMEFELIPLGPLGPLRMLLTS
ncbi:hypothetical protein [Spirosoma pollinicola]|nr:hypothetical protein [Spirosoma pollinicola]